MAGLQRGDRVGDQRRRPVEVVDADDFAGGVHVAQGNAAQGGGHPGAIGFRVERAKVGDFKAFTGDLCSRIESLLGDS